MTFGAWRWTFGRTAAAAALALSGTMLFAAAWADLSAAAADPDDKEDKPELSLRASPQVSFAPARIFLVAEAKGGADDYEPFYCASVEWDWGDGTRSEAKYDCDPYESGKSRIRRRFSTTHTYRSGGEYNIRFQLKQKSKSVGHASATVRVRSGVRDPF